MSVTGFVLIASCLLGVADALQCYSCMDQSADCETGAIVECPITAEFCKLEWTAATSYTSQTCATRTECPISMLKKRQTDSSVFSDINNCCNYDGCNCIGAQCSAASKQFVGGFSLTIIIATTIAVFSRLY